MNETPVRIVLLVVIVTQCIVFCACTRGARASWGVFSRHEEGVLLSASLALCYLAYCFGIVAYLIEPRWMDWGSVYVPPWSRWSGVGPLVAGALFISWGLRTLSTRFAFSVSPQPGCKLVTAGPYRWMRHPLYMGFVIEAIGVSLIMASWFIGLMAALQWGLLVYRIRTEEEKLCACFGDQYRHYRQGTGRFFPKLTR